jgi:hypothetical protein
MGFENTHQLLPIFNYCLVLFPCHSVASLLLLPSLPSVFFRVIPWLVFCFRFFFLPWLIFCFSSPLPIKEKKGSGLFFGKVSKPRIDRGSKVNAISNVIRFTCFRCAYFRILKKIIYYSIFFLALVIISDTIMNELIVLWITLSAILKPRIW